MIKSKANNGALLRTLYTILYLISFTYNYFTLQQKLEELKKQLEEKKATVESLKG